MITDLAQDPSPNPPPTSLIELIYSALDQLYDGPKVNEAIRRLRLALEPSSHSELIQTVRGSGYRFSADVG